MIVFALIFFAILLVAIMNGRSESRKLALLKTRYDQALKGTNRREALQAGRNYYSALRKGKTLTIYDEQAITNDLSTMTGPADF